MDKENHSDDQLISALKTERYKYILQEIHSINENIHKYLTLFQTLATTIISGGIGIFVVWKSLKMDADAAKAAIQGALVLLIIVTLFIITSIIVSVLSWFDYRKEEVELLDTVIQPNFRKPPKLRNFWRWSETYVLIFIIFIIITAFFYVEYYIIPLVK
jgi:hypothetical protein